MAIHSFDNTSIDGLRDNFQLEKIWVLTSAEGHVLREIGFGADGTVKHRFPSDGRFGRYGVFDQNVIGQGMPSTVTLEKFEKVWLS